MAASSLYILYKTSLGETGCSGNPYFIYWLPNHPVFWFALTQSVRLAMVIYPSLCSTCVTYRTLCHSICTLDALHPNPYLGKRRISLGVVIIPSICLCSHILLDCNQFVIHLKFLFIHVNISKVLLVVKTLIKIFLLIFC